MGQQSCICWLHFPAPQYVFSFCNSSEPQNRRNRITTHLLKKRAGSRLFFPPVFLQQILIYQQGRWSFESSQRKVVCQEMKSCVCGGQHFIRFVQPGHRSFDHQHWDELHQSPCSVQSTFLCKMPIASLPDCQEYGNRQKMKNSVQLPT